MRKLAEEDKIHRLQKIIELRNEGLSWAKLAKQLDITQGTAYSFVKRHAPEILVEKGLDDYRAAKLQSIQHLRHDGLTWEEISTKLGLTKNAVRNFIFRNAPQLLNEKNPRRLVQITELRQQGMTWAEIASHCNLSRSTIHNFIRRHDRELLKMKRKTI